jgi:superfamily I DNA/RNA helicase
LLVLAGPGAGKTFCLIERIRFLIDRHGFRAERICAFTFTNKAAGEIAHRLAAFGRAGEAVHRGTIHAFCAELLRELGSQIGLEPGFGIADDEYQLSVLRRLEGPRRWHRATLSRFSAHRFRGDRLPANDAALFERYERFLAARRLLDFDALVLRAAELLESTEAAAQVRARWDVVLVDEFQDVNPVQYRVIRALARDHRHVFAVGDDEQSIYSWAGADPSVFKAFVNDFGITSKVNLEENHRCPREIFALARKLVTVNEPIFADRKAPRADRESAFPVRAHWFESDDDEAAWIVEDLRRDRDAHGHAWGDVALLYRKHEIGDRLESACLNAGIPCRLAQGRALSEDPIAGYVIAALRVIRRPGDDVLREGFFRLVLPRALFDEAQAKADEAKAAEAQGGPDGARASLWRQLNKMAARLPRGDENGRRIRRALADCRNLEALGRQHATLMSLVLELLSRRVGPARSLLDEHHDEISDPASHDDVVALAARLREARAGRTTVRVPPLGGADIAIKGMLAAIGVKGDRETGRPGGGNGITLGPDDVPSVGLPLGVFKAAQLLEMEGTTIAFKNFTAVDLETTDADPRSAEIVEIGAARVRDGKIVETFETLVKPRVPISPGAAETSGIHDADVAGAPPFEEVWPRLRAFCGTDVLVAHNGYGFDFPILGRLVAATGARFDACTFDTLPLARDLLPASRKLGDLARAFGVPLDRAHRALDDAKALAQVLPALEQLKLARARKTALSELLGHLGIALALTDDAALNSEARMFLRLAGVFSLGRHSGALEWYSEERGDDPSAPSVDDVINRLGGPERMAKIRAEKTADERYPATMLRLRRLIAEIPDVPLDEQLSVFLQRAALSRWDGSETERERVNLLTLHSTKGLEFSRVYVVGAEDAQLPGGSPTAGPRAHEVAEGRRLLYVGMTRAIDRLILTYSAYRGGKPSGGHRFLDEMELVPRPPA